MKVKSIRVSKGITASVGKFESVRLDYEIEVELGQGDTANVVAAKLTKWADAQVNNEVKELRKSLSPSSIFKL